jgi:hypothetical protein
MLAGRWRVGGTGVCLKQEPVLVVRNALRNVDHKVSPLQMPELVESPVLPFSS